MSPLRFPLVTLAMAVVVSPGCLVIASPPTLVGGSSTSTSGGGGGGGGGGGNSCDDLSTCCGNLTGADWEQQSCYEDVTYDTESQCASVLCNWGAQDAGCLQLACNAGCAISGC